MSLIEIVDNYVYSTFLSVFILIVKIMKIQIFLYNSFLTKSNLHFKIILLLIKQLNAFSGNLFGLRRWQHCRDKFILSSVTVTLCVIFGYQERLILSKGMGGWAISDICTFLTNINTALRKPVLIPSAPLQKE